jgi:outer membrane protein assembly factor BamB
VPWPQAGGPDGTWRVPAAVDAPVRWSVTANENVLWRVPLPNEGQGGIAVAGQLLFVETFEPGAAGSSARVLGHAVDRRTGQLRWSVAMAGSRASPIAYSYSDATSWSPITDGAHVWFFDSGGEMGCWDLEGHEVWRRKFPALPDHFPFNRQHEPILFGNTIITLEPRVPGDAGYDGAKAEWNYLRGLDKSTGKTLWIAEDASTHYNTAVLGRLPDGTPAILHGRGGPHGVPERPIGLTMTSLAPGREGRALWRYEPSDEPGGPVDGVTFMALYTMSWDARYAYWFRNAPEESHLVLDAMTGKLLRTQSLIEGVDVRQWDLSKGAYVLHANADLRTLPDSPAYPLGGGVLHVLPNWHANIVAGGYHYFFTSTNNRRNGHAPPGHSGPAHCIGRVNVETGKVEYLEVPVGIDRSPGAPERLLYGRSLRTTTTDNQGRDVAGDPRSRTDGWEIPAFFASPIGLGGRVYMGTTLGLTYVVDAAAPALDEHALVGINDLGPLGQTWSLAGPSFSDGVLYHHSLRELVAIGASAKVPSSRRPAP